MQTLSLTGANGVSDILIESGLTARAGKAIVQMTPVKADLENIFIELTESDQPEGQPQASTPGKEEPQDESRVEA